MTRVNVRIDIDYNAIGKLAKGPSLRTDLARRAFAARAAAEAAAPEMQEGRIRVLATTKTGSDRVRGIVLAQHPGVVYAEAKHRFLGGAIDAAGG